MNVDHEVEIQKIIYNSKNLSRRNMHLVRHEWVTQALAKHSGKKLKALEIGPGSGIYLSKLSEGYGHVTSVEVSEKHINSLSKSLPQLPNVELIHSDIFNLDVSKRSMDLILCTEVLEHINDTEGLLSAIHKRLTPGGKLILTTPQKYNPLEIVGKFAYQPGIISIIQLLYGEPVLDPGHINLHTESSLKRAIKKFSFEIICEDKLGFYAPFISEIHNSYGFRINQYLERTFKNSFLDFLLCSQCYVLRKT